MSLIHQTIGQCLSGAARTFGSRPALIGGTAVFGWRQTEEETDRIARTLIRLGAGKGSHIGIWAADTPAFALCFYAIVKLGAIAVLLNTSCREEEISHLLRYADVEFLLIGGGYRDVDYPQICEVFMADKALPKLREVVSIDETPSGFKRMDDLTKQFDTADAQVLQAAKNAVSPKDAAAILFTSGTTARPKGAVLTHYGMVNNSLAMAESLRAAQDDRLCLSIPLFHCFSLSSNLLSCLHSGAALVFPSSRHSADMLAAIQEQRCTLLNAVPTLLLTMIHRPDFAEYDLSSLRAGILGGASTSPAQYREMREGLKMVLLSSLGQTEATAGITMLDYDAPIEVGASTVGGFLPHIQGKIISLDDGKNLPTGETGELCIRGYGVMKSYYRPDLDGTQVDEGGWLYTGDLGFLDEGGNLHMAGRRKEIIIRGGENISPAELEEWIGTDPRVETVKCVGVPDAHFGEEICACVKLKPGETMGGDEVRNLVCGRLAYYKVPKYVLFVDYFETTASGKIRLDSLKDYALQALFPTERSSQ